MNPFKLFFPKKMVGIDLGTSSIKVVEISASRQGKALENYGEMQSSLVYKEDLLNSEKGGREVSAEYAAESVKAIIKEAKIKTKSAIFSIPDFSTFCTSFEMPSMPEKEIAGAVQYNASQFITLPINEVTLDWRIISKPNDSNGLMNIFLVAVPNQVIQEYQTIAKNAGLELYALEAEALGISRILTSRNKKTICILDIGVQSSTVNIVEKGFLRRSYSFNFYSNQLPRAVAAALSMEFAEAERITKKEGIISSRPGVSQALYLVVDPLLLEIKNICAEFLQQEQRQVQEIYLTGGTANLPGLKEYFAESLKQEVSVPNCFSEFLYPPILEGELKGMSPGFSAAVGVALGGLETTK